MKRPVAQVLELWQGEWVAAICHLIPMKFRKYRSWKQSPVLFGLVLIPFPGHNFVGKGHCCLFQPALHFNKVFKATSKKRLETQHSIIRGGNIDQKLWKIKQTVNVEMKTVLKIVEPQREESNPLKCFPLASRR